MRIAAMSVLLLLTTSTPSAAVECFDCTNFPTDITCTSTASCEGVGCYFALSNDEKVLEGVVLELDLHHCKADVLLQAAEQRYCVCFGDFCNTPVEIEKAVDLRHTPFTSDPLLPWNEVTTPGPATTTHERITFTAFTIPLPSRTEK
ncbi:hypothetical protein M3Y99_00733600 [Aphelenchoides fujianensis]|nr:hypothetical protein M3Y99_00733600 [Aphelenchoides fujianensis]